MTETSANAPSEDRLSALEQENLRLRTEVERLREENRKWARLAGTDNLTGLPNRVSFLRAIMPSEVRKAVAEDKPISSLLLSADNLGTINEKHGRWAGDEVIKGLATYLRTVLTEDEKLGHIDGTNFAIVFQADIADARNRAKKLRSQIRSRPFECADETVQITVSIGLCSVHDTEVKDPRILTDVIFKRLNEVLYTAKKDGGDRVEPFPETEVSAADAKSVEGKT